MRFGYARVSTAEQNLDLQMDALRAAGCDEIVAEKQSGASIDNRPEFQRMRDKLRSGDTVVVWKLDRVGRNMPELVELVTEWERKGIKLECLTGDLNPATPAGKMMMWVFGALAEYEKALIKERADAGRVAALERGVRFGRPTTIDEETWERAEYLRVHKGRSLAAVCRELGINRRTYYRELERRRGSERE